MNTETHFTNERVHRAGGKLVYFLPFSTVSISRRCPVHRAPSLPAWWQEPPNQMLNQTDLAGSMKEAVSMLLEWLLL